MFFDFSKAFDSIHHSILLSKLEHYGIRGIALDLFWSYLSNRSQSVHLDGTQSVSLPVIYGVPQGSVLGPLLFILYINDIENGSCKSVSSKVCANHCNSNIKFVLFADDTNIFISGRSHTDIQYSLNLLISNLEQYFHANYLHVNTDKTKYMFFRLPGASHGDNHNIRICFTGEDIKQVKNT